jgi:ribulose-5-phosphate 4-epimerase/fuculose-1-phosphate aldolase
VVSGKDLETAVYATEELEETAKLHLLLRGLNPRLLTPGQIRDLVDHFGLDREIAAASGADSSHHHPHDQGA